MKQQSKQRIGIIGAGVSGLGAAWALGQHPERYEVEIFERAHRVGGNAITVDVPQDDGSKIAVDIAVTAFIPSVYQNYSCLLDHYRIGRVDTRFSYSVDYGRGTYAHDHDSELRRELQPEIEKFQKLLKFLRRFSGLSDKPSTALAMTNPWNYVSMGQMLDAWGLSSAFRYKVLKPLFVNFVMATNVFDMPASMFSRYLDFFDIERATPMVTWDQGTRNIYRHMLRDIPGQVHLSRPVAKVQRDHAGVTIIDEAGRSERFDRVIFACNANQALMMLEAPTFAERNVLGRVRYESELHNHAIVHSDASVLPKNATDPIGTRSNYVLQYGARPDNYEITYIMHNQQPWAKGWTRPCLVTYNPIQRIDESKVVERWWFQHCIHDRFHTTVLLPAFAALQGHNRTHYVGAHTIVNSQEHCFLSGLATARQLGADYPFAAEREARTWFNHYGRLTHGRSFATV